MNRAEWKEARRGGIGGSDAAVVLGVSPWKTPLELYLEKRGEGPEVEENEYMRWGNLLEPVIRQRYADVTGMAVAVPDEILKHPKHPFMIANVDGLLPDRVLEVKTSRTGQGWGEEGSDEIPQPYLAQVTHYMSVTGRELADVAVLIGGSDFRIFSVELDRELEHMMIEKEQEFWKMVESETPPEPRSFEDVQKRFGKSSVSAIVQASPVIVDVVRMLKETRDELENLKAHEERLKFQIMKEMGEADTLAHNEDILATWKLDKPGKRLNQKYLKETFPEQWEESLEDKTPTRRFLLK
jgi:putative phage-type endonuclease